MASLTLARRLSTGSHRSKHAIFRFLSATTSPKAGSDEKEPRVVVESSNSIAEVILNRPSRLNALDLPMFHALRDTLRNGIPSGTRCVILRGRGKSFSAGLDVKSVALSGSTSTTTELLERYPYHSPNGSAQTVNLVQDVAYGWRQLPMPVICVIQGHCYGGGLQIALGADLRYAAAATTQLSVMESAYGLIPDMSASVTLRELVRMDVAKELTFTGRVVGANEAEQLGLVTRAVDDPLEVAREMAQQIVDKSPDAIRLAKRLYQTTWTGVDEETALQTENDFQKELLLSWNQMAASGRKLTGLSVPYIVPKGKK